MSTSREQIIEALHRALKPVCQKPEGCLSSAEIAEELKKLGKGCTEHRLRNAKKRMIEQGWTEETYPLERGGLGYAYRPPAAKQN